MPELSPPSPAVVVGIDGSRSAVDAALWAIDEAIDRDLPLRLLYAIEPRPPATSDTQSMTHDFTTAEAAVQYVSMAIESAERPVKVEVEIVQERCVDALVAASRSAAMICLGARGINGASGHRVGTTVRALVGRARCPVTIVRQCTHPPSKKRWIAVEFDGSPEAAAVLECAFEQARLRAAPLHVLTGRRPMFPEVRDPSAGKETSRIAKADLEHSLAPVRSRYPEVDVKAVAVPGNPINYLARHIDSIGLIVLGHDLNDELFEFAWPTPRAGANDMNCSVLVCERRGAQ